MAGERAMGSPSAGQALALGTGRRAGPGWPLLRVLSSLQSLECVGSQVGPQSHAPGGSEGWKLRLKACAPGPASEPET